jgi:cytochrome oxidase assembly protein ShyY1
LHITGSKIAVSIGNDGRFILIHRGFVRFEFLASGGGKNDKQQEKDPQKISSHF